MKNRRLLIAVVGTGASAAMIFNILPVFLGKAAESYSLSDSQTGWLGTIYLAGFGLSSASAVLWLHRVNRRVFTVGSFGVAAFILLLGLASGSFAEFALTLFLAGLALGVLYTLSFVLAGEFQDTTRAVGIKLGGEVGLGALLLLLLPVFVYPAFGFDGILVALATVLLIASPCARFVSPSTKTVSASPVVLNFGDLGISRPTWIGLQALLVFTVCQSAVWSFAERAGVRTGYEGSYVSIALSVAVLLGGLGSLVAAAVSERFGKSKPLRFAATAYLLSMLVFVFNWGFFGYALAVGLFFFVWLFTLPYFVSEIAASDSSGRGTSLITACFAFGSMLGPVAAGYLVSGQGFLWLYGAAALFVMIAYYMILGLVRRGTSR